MTGDLLVVLALVGVPGAAAVAAAFPPGRAGLATRIALVAPFGYAVVGVVGFVLAAAGVLHAIPFLAAVAVVTAGLSLVALRRAGFRSRVGAIVEEVRSDPWTLGVGLAVFIGFAIVRLGYLKAFPAIGPLRYWVDGLEVADGGRFPTSTLMYGSIYPAVTSKVVLNAFNGGLSFLAGRSPVGPPGALVWLAGVGTFAGLWAAGRELGLRMTAPLVALFLVANRVVLGDELTRDLNAYKAEAFGRMVAIGVLLLGIRAIRDRRGWLDPALLGGLGAVAAATHLVPLLVAVILLGLYALTAVVLGPDRRALLARGAAGAGIAAVVAALFLFLPPGDVGFGGARSGAAERVGGFDEGRYLFTGEVIQPPPPPGPWYVPPGSVYLEYVHRALGRPLGGAALPLGWTVLVVPGLVAAAVFLWGPRHLRPIAPMAWGLGAALVGVALVFSFRYDAWITATFGVRRLYEYASVPLVLLGAVVLEIGIAALVRWRAWLPVAAGVTAVVVAAVVLLPSARAGPRELARGPREAAVLSWIRENTPCDARILMNQRSVGAIRGYTGRVGILEGMGPFLRPVMLHQVVDLMLRARDFFADPAEHQSFLSEESVDYVVILEPDVHLGYAAPLGAADAVAARRPLLLAGRPGPPGAVFLEVEYGEQLADGGRPHPQLTPTPTGLPGYQCERGPLRVPG